MKLCYVYSLESPNQDDSNEHTQHTNILDKIEKKTSLPDLAPLIIP